MIIINLFLFLIYLEISIIDSKHYYIYSFNHYLIILLGFIRYLLGIPYTTFEFISLLVFCILLGILYHKSNESIGSGDIKLMMVSAFYMGVQHSIHGILIGSLSGIVFALISKKHKIPFGPFLVFGYMWVILKNAGI